MLLLDLPQPTYGLTEQEASQKKKMSDLLTSISFPCLCKYANRVKKSYSHKEFTNLITLKAFVLFFLGGGGQSLFSEEFTRLFKVGNQ